MTPKEFVKMVANTYIELSHDKVFYQYCLFIKEAQKILKEQNEIKTTK